MRMIEARPGVRLAMLEHGTQGRCGFFWLGGFLSDMTGTKAEALAELARATGRPCLRFDYSGHGASDGDMRDGTISLWLAEALGVFRDHAPGPRIVVGSSMGGWLAALLLRALGAEAARVKGLILIAPAHDMTRTLMWDVFTEEARQAIARDGVWHRPSTYGAPYPITRALIEDGDAHLLLGQPFHALCPVRILHGDADPDVPWQHGKAVYDGIAAEDARFILVKGGDHRLSAPRDLDLLKATALDLAERAP